MTINTHQQSCFPLHEQHSWIWATGLHIAKDMKERVSAALLVPTVFLWHSESFLYALKMEYLFYLLYPTFRVYQGSAHLRISESSQSQNIQILFHSVQPDLSIVPVVSAAHSQSLETLSWSQILLKTIHGSIHFRYFTLLIWLSFLSIFLSSSFFKLLQFLRCFYNLPSSTHLLSQLACPVACLPASICPSLSLYCPFLVGHSIFSQHIFYHLYAGGY